MELCERTSPHFYSDEATSQGGLIDRWSTAEEARRSGIRRDVGNGTPGVSAGAGTTTGMLLSQNGGGHDSVPWPQHWDPMVTVDNATGGHDAMRLVIEECTRWRFAGLASVIQARGLVSPMHTDHGSQDCHTPQRL